MPIGGQQRGVHKKMRAIKELNKDYHKKYNVVL
jgi:hypothetical protein